MRAARASFTFSMILAAGVWATWLSLGGEQALANLLRHWPVSLTMVAGSLVGGGTSEGGGAVAFPIFTKLLHIPADQARLFTYAIQSVGMTTASLTIVYARIPVERTVIRYAAPGGVIGIIASSLFIAPRLALPTVRVYFTVLLASLALALLVLHVRQVDDRNLAVPVVGRREKLILFVGGLAGGVVSGMVGIGENTVTFILIVLLFRVSEKIATPTTVILMTIVSVTGFLCHLLMIDDYNSTGLDYWQAAIPVVVVGAPVGALVCARMSTGTIRLVLIGLIGTDVASTIALVPMTDATKVLSVLFLAVVAALIYWLSTVRRYAPNHLPARDAVPTTIHLRRHVVARRPRRD